MSVATLAAPTTGSREDWLNWRHTGVGASEASAVLGVNKYETPLSIYLRKVGLMPETEENESMRWGTKLEPLLAEAYTENTGATLVAEQVMVRSAAHPFMLATLDRMRADGVPVELKTIGLRAAKAAELGDEGTDEIPFTWLCQALHQMVVADTDRVDVAALIGGQEFRVFPVHRDARAEGVIKRMVVVEAEFWERVETRTPPLPDLDRDARLLGLLYHEVEGTADLDPSVGAVAGEWERVKSEISGLEKERDRYKAELLNAMETLEVGRLPDGRLLTRKMVSRDAYNVKACSYVDLRIKKGGK